MSKSKNIELRKEVILELAKDNDYISIPELSNLKKLPFETIDNYFKENNISNLIEYKSINKVTVTGNRLTKVYKLKPGLDNLLSVFDLLNDRFLQKELMYTDYYKNFIPYIDKKARELFNFTDSDHILYDNPDAKIMRDICFNLSPSTVNFILKVKVDKKDEKFFQKLLAEEPPSKLLLMALYGLLFADTLERIIPEEELIEFHFSGLLK